MSTLAIYSRVSTDEQKLNGLSLKDQVLRGVDASKIYGYKKYETFQDAGFSGTLPIEKRPALNSLIGEITAGKIQGLFVTDIDRLSRDHMTTLLLKTILKENKIRLYDVNGEIKLNDVNEDLLTNIKSIVASYEIAKTSGRIKRVLERNAMEGKVGGGALLPYGYTKDEKKKLVIDEEEAEVVRRIFELSIQGKGTKAIAEILNNEGIPTKRNKTTKGHLTLKKRGMKLTSDSFVWRDKTIYGILTNTLYKGRRVFKGVEYDCPAIVTPEVFELAQTLMKKRTNFKDTTNKYFYLLKGLMVCKRCGQGFYGRHREDLSDHQYICISQRYRAGWCGNRGINIDRLNDIVWNNLKTLDKDLDKFYHWYESSPMASIQLGQLENTNRDIDDLEQQIKNLIRLGTSGKIPDEFFTSEMERMNAELVTKREDREKLTKSLRCLEEKADVKKLVKKYMQEAKNANLTDEQKANLLRIFIDKVEIEWVDDISQHNVYIRYKIDGLTQFHVGTAFKVDYRKNGSVYHPQNLFKSHITIQQVVNSQHDEQIPPMVEVF